MRKCQANAVLLSLYSLSDDLNASWPSKKKKQVRHHRRKASVSRRLQEGQHQGQHHRQQRHLQRPKTAVLKRPVVLDETLKDKVDMTLTKKQFLAAVKLCKEKLAMQQQPAIRNRMHAAVGYKSGSGNGGNGSGGSR